MKICFWNTARKTNVDLVARLCHLRVIDVLVLAECSAPLHSLLQALNQGQESIYYADSTPGLTKKLTILTRLLPGQVRSVRDTGDVAIRELRPPIEEPLLLVALHLPSRLYYSEDDLASLCPGFVRVIRDAEVNVGHQRTVVIGDFNMSPFEAGMIGATGFHAVMDRRVASRRMREVRGQDCYFFYNPMWSKMGDFGPEPPGTYFYDGGKPVTMYWHVFDQLLVRPSLAMSFQPDDIAIVTSIGTHRLTMEANARPDHSVSDHLPLVANIAEIQEVPNGR